MTPTPSTRQAWFAKVPGALFESDLSTGARMTYAALCLHADRAGKCWPRQRQLVLETGATARSVKRWLKELETADVITRTRATGKWGRPTTYQLHPDRLGATVSPKVRGHSITIKGAKVSPKSGILGAKVSPPYEQIHSGEQSHRTAHKTEGGAVAPRRERAAQPAASNDTPPRPSWGAEGDALRAIPGYPFDEAKDRAFMDSLAEAYGQLDLAKELREMKSWLTAKGLLPLRGQTGPRQRVYRWMCKADEIQSSPSGYGRAAADSGVKRATAGPRNKNWHAI